MYLSPKKSLVIFVDDIASKYALWLYSATLHIDNAFPVFDNIQASRKVL